MLDEATFNLMRRVLQQHTEMWAAEVPTLTKPQYAVLCALQETPGRDQSTLAQIAGTKKGTLTDILQRLESRGLLYRQVDIADRRHTIVYLTQEGKDVLTHNKPSALLVDESFLSELHPDDRRHLDRILSILLSCNEK